MNNAARICPEPRATGAIWDPALDRAWKSHAVRLAGQLVRHGVLTDGAWRDAVLDVPRHHYTPSYYTATPPGPGSTGWHHHHRPDAGPDAPAGHAWLRHVYAQVPLVVALSGINIWGRQYPVAVSPHPATTMRLLHTLDIRATDRVLELGTGSAHTTALLARRVGAEQLTSVEIDHEVHHLAARQLDQLGHHPHLILADDMVLDTTPLHPTEVASRGFDRVLVGHTVDHLPAAWLHHTHPGSLVLTTLTGGLGIGHPALLHHTPGGRLTGPFLPWPTDDLPARRHHARLTAVRRPATPAATRPRHRSTPVDPTTLHANTPLALLHQLHLPGGTTAAVRTDAHGRAATYLHAPDSSWAEIAHQPDRRGHHDARVAGPTNLLDALTEARDTHHDLHRPGWTDLGLTTATRSAPGVAPPRATSTVVWCHDADTGPRWPVHPAPVRLGPTS
ncbi:rRNA adenine N-6-methyltransferase family protein [Pseudonocardia sichuanensis]|uniref:Protein-L-isoaspartate O-methyltransferase n=1 Tax=Pseudonocardia kunmingensis TaxID=630975 RepID=A0A543D9S5_9PSEU|nr:rRNA adenine N-6-methyltransferase family protein [Pseudonocardia kunmingensis]TQM06028.1 protein-L-isoaspartate O-methyltransferase [Pseudonocardia kunmingensis]